MKLVEVVPLVGDTVRQQVVPLSTVKGVWQLVGPEGPSPTFSVAVWPPTSRQKSFGLTGIGPPAQGTTIAGEPSMVSVQLEPLLVNVTSAGSEGV
jgi:hypothetical protein